MSENGVEQDQHDLETRAIYEDTKGTRVNLNPEVPMNHKWFKGEFHYAAWGGESSEFKGDSKDRVRVSMIGKTIRPDVRNGIPSVYGVITAVLNPEDRDLIGQTGWWRLDNLSKSNRPRKTNRR